MSVFQSSLVACAIMLAAAVTTGLQFGGQFSISLLILIGGIQGALTTAFMHWVLNK